jgi:hypothetical protein
MQWTETFGYLGALMTLTTFSMKTMVHLRMVGIVSNLAFISYGAFGHVYPVLMLHLALLPLNVWRLWQLLQLTRQIEEISGSQLSMEWLKPFSRRRTVQAGETLFRRGDAAAEVPFVLSGRFRAMEADVPGTRRSHRRAGPDHQGAQANADRRLRRGRLAPVRDLRRGAADVLPESQVRLLLPGTGGRAIDARRPADGTGMALRDIGMSARNLASTAWESA